MKYPIFIQIGKLIEFYEKRYWVPVAGAVKRKMPGLTLYHFQISPFAQKVRKAIFKLGLDIPTKDVLLDEKALNELVTQGGLDQVPCLRIERGNNVQWLYESDEIVKYLKTV